MAAMNFAHWNLEYFPMTADRACVIDLERTAFANFPNTASASMRCWRRSAVVVVVVPTLLA